MRYVATPQPGPKEGRRLARVLSQVRFLPCYIYTLHHRYTGEREVLVEEELEGKFVKW